MHYMGAFIAILLTFKSLDASSIRQDIPSEEIESLTNRIAERIHLAKNTGTLSASEVLENILSNYLDLPASHSNKGEIITEFWNSYCDKMLVTDELLGYNTPMHLLKMVVEMGVIPSFYFDYFLKDRTRNVNSIEYVNGEPETLLDYLDKTLADPVNFTPEHIKEIRQLKAFIVKYMDAKYSKDLLGE